MSYYVKRVNEDITQFPFIWQTARVALYYLHYTIHQTLSYTIKSQLRIKADNLRNSHCVLDLEIN